MLIAGLAMVTGPVSSASEATAGRSTTTVSVSGCSFTVTYTWSGFNGRELIASFGLYERKAGLDMSFNLENVPGQLGKSGSVTHTFNLAPNVVPGGRTIVGRGELVNSKSYAQVSGSSSASGTSFSTCG
jgi:hypothetical protein